MMDIPRKLHADDGHPLSSRFIVALNGVQQHAVREYDMDAGFVVVPDFDERGNFKFDGDEIAEKRVYGTVTVKVRPE